jgi:hypothetical protein
MTITSRRRLLFTFLVTAVGALVSIGIGSCKSRSVVGGGGGSGLRDAGSGPGELDKILKELEVVDCTAELCDGGGAAGELDNGAGGVAFVNPASDDLQVAAASNRAPRETNPLGDLDYGGAFDSRYALAMKSGKSMNPDGEDQNVAVLGEVADGWNAFNATTAPIDRTQIATGSVETVIVGFLGAEVANNPESLDAERLTFALQRLEVLFEAAKSGRIGEAEFVGALDELVREGGLGHPAFTRAAANAVNPGAAQKSGSAQKSSSKPGGTSDGRLAVSKDGPGLGNSPAQGPGWFNSARFTDLIVMQGFYNKNLVAGNPQKKSQLLNRLKALLPTVRQVQQVLMRYQITDEAKSALMDTARLVAGQDGFINYGDLPRLLPVVPQLVGEIADQKIEEGLADGIAQLRRDRPFVYRRWARAPNGLIGRTVNRTINKRLNAAYGQKYAAINQASAEVQKLFNGAMGRIGATRYFTGTDSPTNYYDPAQALELPQIDRVIRALTGRSIRSIAEEAANRGGRMEIPPVARELSAAAEKLFAEVELPDGIFVAEGLFAIQQKIANPDALVLPHNIQVVLEASGKIRIGQRREPCSCEYSAKVGQCVYFFTPIVTAGEKNSERFYQGLGPGFVPGGGQVVRNRRGQVVSQGGAGGGGDPQCDEARQCAGGFQDRGYKYFMPHACGGYFWTRPGNILYTAP